MEIRKEMQDFLIYSYFGYDEFKTYKDLTSVCINKAFLDMSRKIPYVYSVSQLENAKKKEITNSEDELSAEKAKEFIELKKQFKNNISNYLNEQLENEKAVIDIICNLKNKANKYYLFKKDEYFSLGLSQKWVNMTLKYLWLFDKLPKNFQENDLDVPLDSYILKAIIDDSKTNKYGIYLSGLEKEIKKIKWSTLYDENLYTNIQKEIKNTINDLYNDTFSSAIAWENAAWIEQAKIVSEK